MLPWHQPYSCWSAESPAQLEKSETNNFSIKLVLKIRNKTTKELFTGANPTKLFPPLRGLIQLGLNTGMQISAKRGSDSRFIVEANTKAL